MQAISGLEVHYDPTMNNYNLTRVIPENVSPPSLDPTMIEITKELKAIEIHMFTYAIMFLLFICASNNYLPYQVALVPLILHKSGWAIIYFIKILRTKQRNDFKELLESVFYIILYV